MYIARSPRMTKMLANSRVFREAPFTLIDVGSLGGVQSFWSAFGVDLRVIAFEPNPDECARLLANADERETFLPYALGSKSGTRKLFLHRNPSSSSFFEVDEKFNGRILGAENKSVVDEVDVSVRSLDEVLPEGDYDFIKLDAEGSDCEILNGAKNILSSENMLGILTEIRLNNDLSRWPLFSELDSEIRPYGYRLYDLEVSRMARKTLPYPQMYDFRHDKDARRPIMGAPIAGQAGGGDAFYARDLVASSEEFPFNKVLKLACVFELFGHADSAAELIVRYRKRIDQHIDSQMLLNALVPTIRGETLSYDEYMKRYYDFDPFFRPSAGRCFPPLDADIYDDIDPSSVKAKKRLRLWASRLARGLGLR